MSARACNPIREQQRYRTIVGEPQGLAVLGPQILVSFRTSPFIHTLDLATSRLEEWRSTPAIAYGLAASSDRVWAVCGFGPEADRHVFEYDLHGRQLRDPIRCPDGIGSYISYAAGRLYLSQWYNQRVFELGVTGDFVPLLTPKRGICGIDASNGSLTVLTTPDEKSESYFLERYDLSNPLAGGADVATVPFRARSLAWTGSEYLTSHREADEIVAFTLT